MGLKDMLLGKKKPHRTDYGSVRSHVLNNRFGDPILRDQPFQGPRTVGQRMHTPRQRVNAPEFPEPFQQPPFEQPPFQEQPFQEPSFEPVSERKRMDFGTAKREDYEIIDRLNIIESQLAAIRSQTETINERLKNLERQFIGRRY